MQQADDTNLSPAELERRLKEKKWEEVQVKGLAAWVNSYLAKQGLPTVQKLPDDLQDGVKLMQFLEIIHNTRQEEKKKAREEEAKGKEKDGAAENGEEEEKAEGFERFYTEPRSRIQKLENCSKALKYITTTLGVRLVGIGSGDLVDGNLTLILGMLWSSFRLLSLGSLSAASSGKGSRPEDDLLKWIAEMTEGYRGVNVTSFKTSFNDGLAWAALIDRFDPEFINFGALNQSEPDKTLEIVFDVAEKKLGIPRLFETKDLTEGTPDERSVILYSSLFYHAWSTNEDRIKLANERRGLGNRVQDMQSKLQMEEQEKMRALKERDSVLEKSRQQAKLLSEEEERLEAIEAALRALEEERERIRKLLREEMIARKERILKDIERLTSQRDELKRLLAEAQDSKDAVGRRNIDLLTENEYLLQQIKKGGGLGATGNEQESQLTQHLGSLSALLREHVSALQQQFQRLQDTEENEDERAKLEKERRSVVDDVKGLVEESKQKNQRDEANAFFEDAYKSATQTMTKVLRVKDAINELHEVVDKRGYLMAQVEGKRWKKRWFVLRGFELYYYNTKEEQDDIAGAEGEISLEHSIVVPIDLEGKPKWTIKITVTERDASSTSREELVIGTKTKEERDDWLFLLRGKMLYLQYLNLMEQTKSRPDTRIVSLFSRRSVGTLNIDGKPLTVPVLRIIGGALAEHKETERISLTGASIDDEGLAVVGEFVQGMPGLLSLNLARNNFTSAGVAALAQALSEHTSLQELNLSHNPIGDEGVLSICPVIEANADLDTVSLASNKISGAEAARALVKAFSSLKLLSAVRLQDNEIVDEAAAELAHLLESHPGIIEIKLQGNQIGDDGALAIFRALQSNKVAKQLDLSRNAIGSKGVEGLKDLFANNEFLEKINLSANRNLIGGPELTALTELGQGVEIEDFEFTRP